MDFSLTTLFVLPSGTLAPDNFKRENLHPAQFGIFNSRYKAVTNATDAAKSPYVQFGQGRIEKVPGLGSKYSDKVSPKSLVEWYKVTGSKENKNQITYVGFDGVDLTKTLKAGCDQVYSLTVNAFSEYINTGFANGLTRTVTVTTPCCADCGNDCETIDAVWLAKEYAKKINQESFLSKYVVATPIFSCTPSVALVTVPTVSYDVTLLNSGSAADLAALQAQYPTVDISVKSRVGLNTTYTFSQLSTDAAPVNAIQAQSIALAVCGVCPPSFVLAPEKQVYLVTRILAGTEVLSTPAQQQAFATTVAAEYFAGAIGTFLSIADGGAEIKIEVPVGSTLIVVTKPDIIVQIDNQEALCNPPAGSSVAWTASGVGYKLTRTLRITVSNDCATQLPDVQAQYPNDTVTYVTGANCNSVYELTQVSSTVQTDCGFAVVPNYAEVQSFNGIEWIVYVAPVVGPAPVCSAGVKIEGKQLLKYTGECGDPTNFPFEYDKLRFNVFTNKAPATTQDFILFDRCHHFPVTTTQKSTYVSGSGTEMKLLERRYYSYQSTHKQIFTDNRYNGAFVSYIDESVFYDSYYIKFQSPDLNTWDNVSRQDETVAILVPEGQGKQLENFLLGYFGSEKFTAGILFND